MRPESKALLHDLLQATRSIRRFVAGRSLQEYQADEMLRAAVERKLGIIGEALSVLRKTDPGVAARLPEHRGAISFRNILIHAYWRVDHEIVWDVVTSRLDALERVSAELLAKGD